MSVFRFCELFSGNAHITQRFRELGHRCLSVDWNRKMPADLVMDVYKLPVEFFAGFDFVWLSPDCTTYSLAGHGLHRRKGGVPVSEYAKYCDQSNALLIEKLQAANVPFIIENPRGFFRLMPFVDGYERVTVYYSSYGSPYSKPTDLFSNMAAIKGAFDERCLNTGVHLDRVTQYSNFLGRCLMPGTLVDSICRFVIAHCERNFL